MLPALNRDDAAPRSEGRQHRLPDALVHTLVERRAQATPDALAVRFRDQILTYEALNRRANQLAQHLIERGVNPGDRIVVCMDPALEVIVALLGVLKAGALYVPLDPSYPPARRQTLLDDTQPALVLTQTALVAQLELAVETTLAVDALSADGAALARAPGVVVDAEQPAYVFYTSGTTGTPKGVVGTHANLRHYVQAARKRYGVSEDDVIPALARFGFSISLFELLVPLVSGATLLLLDRDHILDPVRLARTLEEVTLVHAGPSLWKAVVAHLRKHVPGPGSFSRVRHASSGGDMVPPDLLETLKDVFANAEIFVIYGCSEISCMGCTYLVPRQRRVTTTYVGQPFENVTLRVLDETRNLVLPGVAGEIYFAGEGLTRGYWNRPELTRESFVNIEGRRFYSTGDRGRLNEQGLLEVLGRRDSQVKIRGMRVELAEVEQHLRRAPGVRDAVAAARKAPDGETRLVAYVVPETSGAQSVATKAARIAAVRRYLLTHLPDYMAPSVYVELERLPLNHNLKLDRRALPEPTEDDLRALSDPTLREPETPHERALGELFRELLGVSRVGLDDNFFELGGHSLLAQRFCLAVEERLGVTLDGMDLLREPLEVLARLCDVRLGVPVQQLDHATRDLTERDRLETFHFGPEQSLYGVLHGPAHAASEALLICGAVGQEHVRSRFVLKQLARALAVEGVPTLIFDYFGCGDSLGRSGDAHRGRFQADIRHAHAELVQRTGGARVTALGVRLGGLLLADAAAALDLSRMVLWDPICDGQAHVTELTTLHRAYLKSVTSGRSWNAKSGRTTANELLGSTYSDTLLEELRSLDLSRLLSAHRVPLRWLATAAPDHDAELLPCLGSASDCRMECVDLDCGWHDLARLEDLLPDGGVSSALARLVMGAP